MGGAEVFFFFFFFFLLPINGLDCFPSGTVRSTIMVVGLLSRP